MHAARPLFAAAVHAYTALGLVFAAVAAVLIVLGDEAALRTALLMFVLATAIDATDGMLARRARVREALPGFDGRRLDDIVDFHTYTSLPLLLIWRAGVLPGALGWLLLVPLLASAYGFSQVEAKTKDGFFRGFPSYWNVVAFYLFFLPVPPPITAAAVVALALLTFLPTKYLHPSMRGRLNRFTAIAGAVWAGLVLLIVADAFADPLPWVLASFLFPAHYMVASWWLSLRPPPRVQR